MENAVCVAYKDDDGDNFARMAVEGVFLVGVTLCPSSSRYTFTIPRSGDQVTIVYESPSRTHARGNAYQKPYT